MDNPFSVKNNIFANGIRGDNYAISNGNATIDASCDSATQWTNINLGPRQDNGAPTLTHALLTGRDAIDTGDDRICTKLTVDAPGLLSNESDADGDALRAIWESGPSYGTLTLNADGSFTYMPNVNFSGADIFTYQASDGSVDSNVVLVSITANAVNAAPVAADDSYTIDEDTQLVEVECIFQQLSALEATLRGDLGAFDVYTWR
ncbi:MAG: Ig-like domain-containing protein [Chloroflexota bacterium]